MVYSLVSAFIAWDTYIMANAQQAYKIPIVIIGLTMSVGGAWFFVYRRTNKVEASWLSIGS